MEKDEPARRSYVEDCLAGRPGPTGEDVHEALGLWMGVSGATGER